MIALLAMGIVIGGIGGALGVGGGLMLVPILYGIFGWPLISAVATSHFCIVATSLAATVRYLQRSQVVLPLGIRLESATIVGAVLGAYLAPRFPTIIVALLFAAVALFASYRLLRSGPAPYADSDIVDTVHLSRPSSTAIAASGGTGFAASLIGVGGGVFKVPIMALIVGAPIRHAIATSAFMIGITSAAAGVLYYWHGVLMIEPTIPIIIGMLLGSSVGSKLQAKVPATALRKIFAYVLMLLALRMIWNVWL